MKKRLPKRKKRFNNIRFTLYAIIFLVLIGAGWRIYGSLAQSIWDGRNRVNIVFATQPVFIASFSPHLGSLSLLLIPNETYIQTTHGYGKYRIETIWKLGELEDRESLLAESSQEYLGLPVDGWVGGGKEEIQNEKQAKGLILNRLFGLIKGRDETNLTRWDLVRLWWEIRGVRFDKIYLINLTETSAITVVTLPDGTTGFELDTSRLDGIIAKYFQDEKIREEGVVLEVANATNYPGLAAHAARIISNVGGRLISVRDWSLRSKECEVRSKKEKVGSYTLGKLMKIFDCKASGEDLGDSRAEAVLILGENYWEKLNKK